MQPLFSLSVSKDRTTLLGATYALSVNNCDTHAGLELTPRCGTLVPVQTMENGKNCGADASYSVYAHIIMMVCLKVTVMLQI